MLTLADPAWKRGRRRKMPHHVQHLASHSGRLARSPASPTPSATSWRRRRPSRPRGAGRLPEHRRSGRVRLLDPAAPGRGRRPGDARRPQRLRALGRHRRRRARPWPTSTARGVPRRAGSRRHHGGHVGRHRAGAERAGQRRRRGAGAAADLSAVHGGSRQDRRRCRATTAPTRHADWLPDLDHLRAPVTPRTRALVRHRSQQPDRRGLPAGHAAGADRARRAARADDPGRRGLRRAGLTTGRCRRWASLDPDAPIISFSSLSKAYLAPGLAHRLAGGRADAPARRRCWRRSASWPTAGCAAPARCSTPSRRRCAATARTSRRSGRRWRERAALTTKRLNAIPGMTLRRAARGVLRHAVRWRCRPGKTDEDFVLSLLRATGILCVYGSGFGMPAEHGFFRVVFLASPGRAARDLPATWRVHGRLPGAS